MTIDLRLREVTEGDIAIFFEHQQDAEACRMAAFTSDDPTDRAGHIAHWSKILGMETVVARTVVFDGAVAGHVAKFVRDGDVEVTYWIGRDFWGRGIATKSLILLLVEVSERPVFARIAADNVGSRRVLEKCGFVEFGRERGFAAARGVEIDELVFRIE